MKFQTVLQLPGSVTVESGGVATSNGGGNPQKREINARIIRATLREDKKSFDVEVEFNVEFVTTYQRNGMVVVDFAPDATVAKRDPDA